MMKRPSPSGSVPYSIWPVSSPTPGNEKIRAEKEQIKTQGDAEQILAELQDLRFDPREYVILEEGHNRAASQTASEVTILRTGIDEIELAVEMAPDDALNRLYLAEALLEHAKGRDEEAIQILRDLVKKPLNPKYLVEEKDTLEKARVLLEELED